MQGRVFAGQSYRRAGLLQGRVIAGQVNGREGDWGGRVDGGRGNARAWLRQGRGGGEGVDEVKGDQGRGENTDAGR